MLFTLIVTSDKLLTSFLGAAAALFLKYVYDAAVEYKRLADIRKMIYMDMKTQEKYLQILISDCLTIKDTFENQEEGYIMIDEWNQINTDVFKAHSAKDYFLAFDEILYHGVMLIYQNIEAYNRLELNGLYSDYISQAKNLPVDELDAFEKEVILRMDTLINRYNIAVSNIKTFCQAYEKSYITNY